MFNVIGNSPKRKMAGFNSELTAALVVKKLNHREVEVRLTTARKQTQHYNTKPNY